MQPAQPGSVRAIAQVDAARRARRRDRARPIAGAHQHEIGVARPVVQAQPLAGRVEQRLRLFGLAQVVVDVGPILERRQHADDRGDVDAVDRHRAPDRFERCGVAGQQPDPQSGEPERLRKRAADDDVGKRRQLGDERLAAELDVRLVDEHDGVGRARAARWSESPSSGIGTPVGLFGLVRNTTRVSARVIAAEHVVEREGEVGLRHHRDDAAAGQRASNSKISNAGSRNDRPPGRGRPAAAADSRPRSP